MAVCPSLEADVLIYNGVELSSLQPSSQVERQRNPAYPDEIGDPIGVETLRAATQPRS